MRNYTMYTTEQKRLLAALAKKEDPNRNARLRRKIKGALPKRPYTAKELRNAPINEMERLRARLKETA